MTVGAPTERALTQGCAVIEVRALTERAVDADGGRSRQGVPQGWRSVLSSFFKLSYRAHCRPVNSGVSVSRILQLGFDAGTSSRILAGGRIRQFQFQFTVVPTLKGVVDEYGN